MTAENLRAARITHPDHAAAVEEYYRRGWTDGLPVIPPEQALVAAFLDSGGLAAGAVLGAVATRDIVVTAEDVAINAVMAGCLAEYAPVVMTAVALWEEMSPLVRESDGAALRLGRPAGILPVAAGGPGDQAIAVLPPHVGLAVTLPLPTRLPIPPSLPQQSE